MKRRAERALGPAARRPRYELPVVRIDLVDDEEEVEVVTRVCSTPTPSMLRYVGKFAAGDASGALIVRVVRLSEETQPVVAMKWSTRVTDIEHEARLHAEIQKRCGGPRGYVLPLLEWCSVGPGIPMFVNRQDVRTALGRKTFWTKPSAYLLLPLVTGTAASAPSITPRDAKNIDAALRAATDCMSAMNIAHGDVRLANVFYMEGENGNRRWWLGDFGEARRMPTVEAARKTNEGSVSQCMHWVRKRLEAGRPTRGKKKL